MELITRKSECKRTMAPELFIKSPKEISKKIQRSDAPKYCIIVKPFHESFLPYKQIVFRGVTFSDDFSIELIRNNEPVIVEKISSNSMEHLFHNNNNATFRLMQ